MMSHGGEERIRKYIELVFCCRISTSSGLIDGLSGWRKSMECQNATLQSLVTSPSTPSPHTPPHRPPSSTILLSSPPAPTRPPTETTNDLLQGSSNKTAPKTMMEKKRKKN